MLSLVQSKQMSEAFVKEACRYLNLNPDTLRVIFTPYIQSESGTLRAVDVLPDDTIVVGENLLNESRAMNSFTPLRVEMYSCVRYIYQRKKAGGKLKWGEACKDGMDYAMALCFLKGMQLLCWTDNSEEFFAGALKILAEEFNLHCKVFKMPTEPYNGYYFYKVHLEEADAYKLLFKYSRKVPFTGTEPSAGEKGTLENPFDNIYEAVEYLREMEKEAYENDMMMNDIADMDYFYDFNQGHFRISWASPYVAHLKQPFPEKSFIMSQMAPLDITHPEDFYFSLKPNLYKHKFLYRGQADYYPGKPCKPSLFRDKAHNEANDYLDFLIFSQELELLVRTHPIVQLLEEGIELLHDTFRIRMHYSGLAQHYYNKSIMLDFTSDLEVMKFFATTNYKSDTDEYVPCTDENKVGVIYYYELRFPDAFQQHKHYAMKTIGKQVFSRSGLQRGFLLEMDKEVDLKQNVAEIRKVYFRHHADISNEIFASSQEGKEFFPDDILMHAWHDRLKQRFNDKVVSRKAVRLNVERNPGETEESITKKLAGKGIAVDDFEPSFTEEELNQFYDNIESWWNNFCDDVYFADTENALYREAMKEIIHDSRYRWAFSLNLEKDS